MQVNIGYRKVAKGNVDEDRDKKECKQIMGR